MKLKFAERLETLWRSRWEGEAAATFEFVADAVGCSKQTVQSHARRNGWQMKEGVALARKRLASDKMKATKQECQRPVTCNSPPAGFAWTDVWSIAAGGVSTAGRCVVRCPIQDDAEDEDDEGA